VDVWPQGQLEPGKPPEEQSVPAFIAADLMELLHSREAALICCPPWSAAAWQASGSCITLPVNFHPAELLAH